MEGYKADKAQIGHLCLLKLEQMVRKRLDCQQNQHTDNSSSSSSSATALPERIPKMVLQLSIHAASRNNTLRNLLGYPRYSPHSSTPTSAAKVHSELTVGELEALYSAVATDNMQAVDDLIADLVLRYEDSLDTSERIAQHEADIAQLTQEAFPVQPPYWYPELMKGSKANNKGSGAILHSAESAEQGNGVGDVAESVEGNKGTGSIRESAEERGKRAGAITTPAPVAEVAEDGTLGESDEEDVTDPAMHEVDTTDPDTHAAEQQDPSRDDAEYSDPDLDEEGIAEPEAGFNIVMDMWLGWARAAHFTFNDTQTFGFIASHNATMGRLHRDIANLYTWAVPCRPVLDFMVQHAPNKKIAEVGAGTGFWARLLHELGADVVAVDSGSENPEMAGKFFGVQRQDAAEFVRSGGACGRALFMCWPRHEMGQAVMEAFRGDMVFFVGETGAAPLTWMLGRMIMAGRSSAAWPRPHGLALMTCSCATRGQ